MVNSSNHLHFPVREWLFPLAAIISERRKSMKKLLSAVVVLFCTLIVTAASAKPVIPELTPEGFLPAGAEPYVYASRDEGRWVYVSEELYVNILRYESTEPKAELVWFETEIKCAGETRLTPLFARPDKPTWSVFRIPKEIADSYGVVLAFTDDFYGNRRFTHATEGIVIRNGKILFSKTKKNDSKSFPPLEILALFQDGSLKTFKSQEHTAQEYLDMGVTDTFAFGPILVQNGQLGERMPDPRYSPYREPRCALGMVEPNHYFVLTVNGRQKESRGALLPWLAERMIELGVQEALNLDGGNTTSLYFMGDVINIPENKSKNNIRRVTSLIGIGTAPGAADQSAAERSEGK